MKKRSFLSIILAIILCCSSLFVGASALTMGDVDGDGEVKAADARLALRASVGLENFNEEQKAAADVDGDGTIKAADARLILRASVGLEVLPELEKEEHPEYHIFEKISTTGKTVCSFDGCEAELPSFNDIVNALKSTENGANYFTGILEDITHNDKMELSGSFSSMMDDETNVASTATSYSDLIVNRLLTINNFPTNGETYVSALTDSDVKSITIEETDGIDFISALPDSFTVDKNTYDLTAIKSAEFPSVYKVTLVLNPEAVDIKKSASGASTFDKIYIADYNKKLESVRSEINSGLSELATEMENMNISFSSSGTITSSLTVEYFIDAETLTPLAAKYAHRFDIEFNAKIPLFLSMTQKMYMASNSYYFFNNDFGMTA